MNQLRAYLEKSLSMLTMYRLVIRCLVSLLAIAGVFSLAGYFSFSFIDLSFSMAVLLAATYGSNRLFAQLFTIKSNGESAVITGLILACLFVPPEFSVLAMAKLVLIGVIASASKYIVVVRGRHIFNPAAFAVVIASVLGIAYAGWWIATPVLLPVVVMMALMILYKTRRLQMGLLFIAIAALGVIVRSVIDGQVVGEAAWLAVASWPIVFFAGVMLSEPLTQPPRKRQQFIVAALVAVLMVLPIHVGSVSMTPAVALLLGNLLAWWWGARRALTLIYKSRKQLTPTTYEFSFEGNVPFLPGQYIELTLPHKNADARGIRRMFTIATSPGDKQMRFGVKFAEKSSTLKTALINLHPDDIVQATRVAGDFILPRDTKQPVLFIAGGIGITPLISYLRSYKDRNITLIYAVSSPEELAYRDVLAVAGIKVIIVVAKGRIEHTPGGWKIIEGRVTQELLAKEIKDITQRAVYISGPPTFVNDIHHNAKKLGAKKVMTDHFSGY